MLPADTVVLFVHTNDVGSKLAFTIRAGNNAVKVLDNAETVAAQFKVVGAMTKATITEVESLLAVKW